MRRLFSRKSVDDTKIVKEEGKERRTRKLLFGRSHYAKKDDAPHQEASKPQQQAPNQHDSNTNSSASSAVSIPPSAPYLPTPSGSSSSFSSVMSYTELSSPTSDSTAISTVSSSTLSPLPGSSTSISSLSSPPPHPGSLAVPPSSSTPASRPQSSHTEQRKPLSPLSVVVDLHTPPPSDDEEDNLQPKRRNSIYNIFRKTQSQPNLNSGPPSRSSSTTTLPSAYNAPQGSGTTLAPPSAPNNHRKSVKFLRKKSSNNSLEDVMDGEGILSRNEVTARRAILQGDPLGGGAYLYPMGLARKSDLMHQPPPQQQRSRSRRGAAGRIYDPRRSSCGGPSSHGSGGMAWRAPHIGGRNGEKMTIEEENDMMEQHQQHQREMGVTPGDFVEDTPQFQQPQQKRRRPPMNRRPTSSQSGKANSSYGYVSGNHYSRPGYYPPFAPQPMLPEINQQTVQSVQA
ncbi:hypothetical protein BGX38DRAFT_1140805 [Terfezia claveryi]|nr:hypothetical protein BGX38DRAFT_1140805 [Terfezia claveryi]